MSIYLKTRSCSGVCSSPISNEAAEVRLIPRTGFRLIQRISLGRIKYCRIDVAVKAAEGALQTEIGNIKCIDQSDGIWPNGAQQLEHIRTNPGCLFGRHITVFKKVSNLFLHPVESKQSNEVPHDSNLIWSKGPTALFIVDAIHYICQQDKHGVTTRHASHLNQSVIPSFCGCTAGHYGGLNVLGNLYQQSGSPMTKRLEKDLQIHQIFC
mmetsp:Transcript_4915/g.8104  ORF Transcript_4915/g.8104 Transcript_4915/m.8104 type:complete len:210 (+) Transcript_4915:32-661(+)